MTAADRPSVPRVGDTITTGEQLDALPVGVVMRARNDLLMETGRLASGDRVVWGEGWSDHADAIEHFAPLTVLYVPGDRPSVTDNARDEEPLAWCPGCGDRILTRVVRESGVCNECWGTRDDPWAAGRAETTTATTDEAVGELLERMSDAVTRLEALRAEHWEASERQRLHGKIEGVKLAASYVEEARGLLATARTVDVHPTYTVEYQQKIADELGVEREAVLRALGLAAPLLATARTRPTRYEVARAIRLSRTNGLCKPGVRCDLCDCAQEYEDDLALRDADAVLALYADQPTEAEAGARALEQAAEWLRSDMDEPWGDRAANRLDVRAARIRAGGA